MTMTTATRQAVPPGEAAAKAHIEEIRRQMGLSTGQLQGRNDTNLGRALEM